MSALSVPVFLRGELVQRDAAELLDQLPLPSPGDLADLQEVPFEEILDVLEALGGALDFDRNPHVKEAYEAGLRASSYPPSILKNSYLGLPVVFARENVREIAAVEGIGVLWPGAGTLRRLFSTVDEDGQRVLDEEAWEAAIQKVLAACKEFDVACGYPANANDIEERMRQGFSVFVMGWGESGFTTVDVGRRAAGR